MAGDERRFYPVRARRAALLLVASVSPVVRRPACSAPEKEYTEVEGAAASEWCTTPPAEPEGRLFCRSPSVSEGGDKIGGVPTGRPVI